MTELHLVEFWYPKNREWCLRMDRTEKHNLLLGNLHFGEYEKLGGGGGIGVSRPRDLEEVRTMCTIAQ